MRIWTTSTSSCNSNSNRAAAATTASANQVRSTTGEEFAGKGKDDTALLRLSFNGEKMKAGSRFYRIPLCCFL
jgi:hypothetical protein